MEGLDLVSFGGTSVAEASWFNPIVYDFIEVRVNDLPVVTLPGVGHFLQEDAPETVIALIEQFIQLTP